MTELQDQTTAHHRSTIAMTLAPFLDLLKDQKQTMTQTDWLKAVRTLMSRIIEMPEQYLPKDLALSEATTGMIRSVFHEFILAHTPFQFQKKDSGHLK
jgi:hypothetical protein